MTTKQIVGLILVVLAVLGLFYSFKTYADDRTGLISRYYYDFEDGLTPHEFFTIIFGAFSLVCGTIGLYKLCSEMYLMTDKRIVGLILVDVSIIGFFITMKIYCDDVWHHNDEMLFVAKIFFGIVLSLIAVIKGLRWTCGKND